MLVSGELVVGVPGQVEVTGSGRVARRRRCARVVDEAVRREKDLLKKARVKDLPAARELLRKGDTGVGGAAGGTAYRAVADRRMATRRSGSPC